MSKLEIYQQQNDSLISPPQPAGPPSYDQATGTTHTVYPAMPTVYPTTPTVYPSTPTVYPTMPTVHPTMPTVYPPMPTVHPTMPTVYPPMPTVHPTMPIVQPTISTVQTRITAPMEKEGVMTNCSQCHNQVLSSVGSSYNNSAISWIVYSICCCLPFAFFVMCIDHFKTWKHTCPCCRNLLAEYTPEASSGTVCGLVCAVIVNLFLFVLIIFWKLM